MTHAQRAAAPSMLEADVAPVRPMLRRQTNAELLRLLRNPAFSGASLAIPLVLFVYFGLSNIASVEHGIPWKIHVLASMGAYAVVSVALYTFGNGVANERGQRMNVLMRATPLPPAVYLAAKMIAATVFAALALATLFAFAAALTSTTLDALAYATLLAGLLAGTMPFLALGFAIGNLLSPNSAAAVTSLVWIALSLSSGLFLPYSQLPSWAQSIAPYLPAYWYAQLAWSAVGAESEAIGLSVIWLTAYGALFFTIALWAYRREAGRNFD